MTRLEELKAKRNNNDITRTALPDTSTINNQPTRLEQLKASMSPTQMSATPVQAHANNAFNILNNATKIQSYDDVVNTEVLPVGYINGKEAAGPNIGTHYTNLLRKEIEDKVIQESRKAEEEKKKNNPFAFMNDEIMAKFEGSQYEKPISSGNQTRLSEHIAGTGSLGLTDVFVEQSRKNKDITAKVYDEYLEKLRANENEYVKQLGRDNYNKLFEEIYNNSNQKPIDRDFFTQLRLNVGGGNVQGVTNILNTGAMLLNDDWGKNVRDATQWSRDLNKQILQGNQRRGGFGEQVLNASNTLGNMIPTIAATGVNPALGKVALFSNAAGGAYNEALDNGATLGQAKGNAILSGGAELAIESISGGLSNKLLGSKALFNPSNLTKKIGNKFVRTGLDVGLEVLGEGLEEVASSALQPVIDRITYNPNARNATGEELWSSFTESILPTLLMQGIGVATNGINNYHDTQIEQIQNSNLSQEQKTNLINKTTEQRDKLLSEVKKSQQPVQNVAPQSSNDEVQQQTNEVIPQQTENQQNANVVQNNTQIAQNTPNNVQIPQNNVQNAQDLQKTGQNDTKAEIVYNKDGTFNKVKIKENIFENKGNKSIVQTIKQYLTKHIGEYADIIESGQRVYLGKDLPGEYTYSKSAQNLSKTEQLAKGRAASGLKEIINNATNRQYEANRKDKHAIDGKYGFYKYDTTFAFEHNGKEQNYTGTILIRNDANGKKYLYDILNIKKIGSNLPPATSNSQKSSVVNGGSNSLPVNNIIPNTQNYVNNQNIMLFLICDNVTLRGS